MQNVDHHPPIACSARTFPLKYFSTDILIFLSPTPAEMLAGEDADYGVCLSCYSTGTEFGFNNPDFSDRVLRVEVIKERSESLLGKRTREEEECEEAHPQQSKGSSGCEVTSVHINSLVLASKSLFFYKMFSNGMRESYEQVVSLSVQDYEEGVVLDLLELLYNNKLKGDTVEYLLKVIILADKYQVAPCITYCARKLAFMPMTLELTLSCVNLPPSVLAGDNTHLQSLLKKAKCFLSKNFVLETEAALELPLEIIENILSWDTLKVDSEDDICDFILEWARTHHQDPSERRQVLSSRLSPLIRWSNMSCEKLKTVLQRHELNQALLSKPTIQAPRPNRDYITRPVRSITHETPYNHSEVHVELSKDKLTTSLDNSGRIRTQKFRVGDEWFYLGLRVDRVVLDWRGYGESDNRLTVQLFRECSGRIGEALMVEWEVGVRLRGGGGEYNVEQTMMPVSLLGRFKGMWCPIGGSWEALVAEDSKYFIDRVFYLRVTVSLYSAIWCLV